ncbi:MAG: hypothetical protein V4508_21595 [Pseudomonadota bacterium]
MIGHQEMGTGTAPVIVLNDWMGDTSTWDGARDYLDQAAWRWKCCAASRSGSAARCC